MGADVKRKMNSGAKRCSTQPCEKEKKGRSFEKRGKAFQ